MEGEENPSHQAMETEENDSNNRKRTLEGSVSNVPMKRFKVMSTEDQFKWLLPEEMAEYVNDYFQISLPEKGFHDVWKIRFHQMLINRRRWMILLCH